MVLVIAFRNTDFLLNSDIEFRIKSDHMCILITRPLNHGALEGHIHFYNIPIPESLLLMLCEYYMHSLTFLYGSRGKGRRWMFGAHHRYFSLHYR